MRVIGHRGASGYAPENTLASFELALAMGVDMIELDVHTIKTGELVVIHDDTVDATTNGTGHVADFSLEQLRALDAGNGQKIPLLSEVLDLIDRRVPVNVEMKGKRTAEPVANLLKTYIIEKGWLPTDFIVSSEVLDELAQFIRLMPHIQAGAVHDHETSEQFLAFARKNSTHFATVNAVLLDENDVSRARDQGIRVYAYTVNDSSQAARLNAMGVDAVFTDYPDQMRRVISHARAAV
ncbi:MAG TPA: glycerophosphodiester phosphodiesterase family protein [Candidatus Saccharimonadales bacterium]|nr:glycerophosphodiester phosphodiesterase family protein [Candidatus Saccharimonadales bacterium]